MTAELRAELPHHLDLPYGDDPKQRLDVYEARERGTAGPVFVFLHGGGFREGDRAHYGYVARHLAERGIVTVVPSYRLTATASFPAQLEDGQALLAWVHRHVAEYGGDPGYAASAATRPARSSPRPWARAPAGSPSARCPPTSSRRSSRSPASTT